MAPRLPHQTIPGPFRGAGSPQSDCGDPRLLPRPGPGTEPASTLVIQAGPGPGLGRPWLAARTRPGQNRKNDPFLAPFLSRF